MSKMGAFARDRAEETSTTKRNDWHLMDVLFKGSGGGVSNGHGQMRRVRRGGYPKLSRFAQAAGAREGQRGCRFDCQRGSGAREAYFPIRGVPAPGRGVAPHGV